MSVTGSQINLEDGETEKIITDDQGDRTYLVEVVGANAIRVSHTKRYAADGTTLSAGQTHTVSNLRGERLYAAAFDGPSAIRVREAAADVTSQPERRVEVVNADSLQLAAAVGINNTAGTQIDPATNDGIGAELSTPHPREINTWTAGTIPVAVDGTPAVTVDNPGELSTPNGSGVDTFEVSVSSSQLLPSVAVPDGFKLLLKADVSNDDAILIDGTFPISAGAATPLGVSNANTITVAPRSGTQTLYGIVEVA